jgi:hypothetical protein
VPYENRNDNDQVNGYTRFAKAGPNVTGITTCGAYADSDKIAVVNNAALTHCNNHRNVCRAPAPPAGLSDHLFMVYWQLTGGDIQQNTMAAPLGGGKPNATAGGTHFNLPFLLNWLRGVHATQCYPPPEKYRAFWAPNLINLDFINDTVCDQIIAFNTATLTAAGL